MPAFNNDTPRSRFLPVFRTLCVLLLVTQSAPVQAEENPSRQEQKERLLAAAKPLEQWSEVFRLSAQWAAPSIVHIEATRIRSGRAAGRASAMQIEETGSGVIAEFDGKWVVLTNRHVVESVDPNLILIRTSDRRHLTAQRIRTNADFDLAVIEIERPTRSRSAIVPAEFGDSDRVRPGDLILAVGSPFGLERSLSMGIVSAIDRRRIPAATDQTPICGFFQIDAAVNPGSSGGPMLNLCGEIVGLITAIATQGGGNEGVAFVIPINSILPIARQLVENEHAVRPYVGISFDPAFGLQAHAAFGLDRLIGARINRILPDSPASKAGLQVDDIILSVDGREIEDDLHVIDLVARATIGRPISLTVLRDGNRIPITLLPSSQISR